MHTMRHIAKPRRHRFFVPLLLAGVSLAAAGAASAASLSASSCTQSAVQSVVNSAADGDTVLVPAGTCTWSAALTINKPITLKGAGSGSGGTKIMHGGGDHTLVSVDPGTKTGRVDVSGFWFYGEAQTAVGTAMRLDGPNGWKNLRVHHNVFEGNYPWTISASTSTHGLIDHNTFKGRAYGIVLFGDGASDWSRTLTLGTGDFFFIEDNTFDFDDFYGSVGSPAVDMNNGGRQVFRHNTVRHSMWETHDKARSGLVSANAYEIYNNSFSTTTGKWKGIDVSSGTGVIWNNKFAGSYTVPIGAIDYKTFQPGKLRPCDGTDPADQNVPGQSGWRCQYQIGTMSEGPSAYSYPLYVWNNTADNGGVGMSCTSGCTHVQSGRDYINNGSTAKSGYAPFRYPHPLQGSGGAMIAAPTGLRVQ